MSNFLYAATTKNTKKVSNVEKWDRWAIFWFKKQNKTYCTSSTFTLQPPTENRCCYILSRTKYRYVDILYRDRLLKPFHPNFKQKIVVPTVLQLGSVNETFLYQWANGFCKVHKCSCVYSIFTACSVNLQLPTHCDIWWMQRRFHARPQSISTKTTTEGERAWYRETTLHHGETKGISCYYCININGHLLIAQLSTQIGNSLCSDIIITFQYGNHHNHAVFNFWHIRLWHSSTAAHSHLGRVEQLM